MNPLWLIFAGAMVLVGYHLFSILSCIERMIKRFLRWAVDVYAKRGIKKVYFDPASGRLKGEWTLFIEHRDGSWEACHFLQDNKVWKP